MAVSGRLKASDYMAASRRSPSMRDPWRAEDDHRHNRDYPERERPERRARSPYQSRLSEASQLGLKIKGSATVESVVRSGSRHRDSFGGSRREKNKARVRSPRRRDDGEGSKRARESSDPRPSKRNRPRDPSPSPNPYKRPRSITPEHRNRHYSTERRRSRSPRHTDKGVDTGDRRRERGYSPSYSPRRDRYLPSRERLAAPQDRSTGDSYIPSARRGRSRSPEARDNYRPETSRRRSRSPSRRQRHEHLQRPQESRQGSPRRSRKLSPVINTHRKRSVEPHSNHKVTETKSSKRSEKQKLRTLKHLVNKPKLSRSARQSSPSPKRGHRDDKRMQSSTRPIQSILDEQPRQPSPPRPIPSFDDSNGSADSHIRDAFPMHGFKASDIHSTQRRIPTHIDTRQQYATSPQYMTPTSSHNGSPQSSSPYSHGRGGWAGQQPPFHGQTGQSMNAYSPPFRQNSYPQPNGAYYPNPQHSPYAGPHQQMQPGFQSPSYRGGHNGMRGGHFGQGQDRRFSGSGVPNYPPVQAPRGRGGHFQNLQWTANGGTRGRGQADQSHNTHQQTVHGPSQSPPAVQKQPNTEKFSGPSPDDDNPFRPSKDLQVEDESSKDVEMVIKASAEASQMAPPMRQGSEGSQQSKEASKFSFAFKAKAVPPPTAKPVPDLAQKMKEPPPVRKESQSETSRGRGGIILSSRDTIGLKSRSERRAETRDRNDDQRERDYRDEHRYRDERRNEREYRDERRVDHRAERRVEKEKERERERSPEPIMVKKIMKRMKARPMLPADFAASDSVYYRKPGNESVVGSGTYGKVFKAIHVYTKSLVALKKIRMEGEKDGFPVTAVREIKLLQSLKHENIVSLHEVMVEKNDCFMVFEYLSHDLTGLLNHPTFKLEHSHKKHLAKQLFEGLDYLHRRGVLHRDIKAANILVSSTGQLKLADFGLARFYAKRRQLDYTNRVITIWYRPPELLLGETQYGPAVDIWSAACVMIEIFTKHAIFPGDGGEINQLEKVYNILGTPTRTEWPGLVDMAWFELLRPTEKKPNIFAEKYRERLTPAAFELLQAMFLYDPAKRPTAGDVLEHPYFTTEEPAPVQAVELKDLQGDWHEFESKALRRENERKDKEARRAFRQEEHDREKAKRRASGSAGTDRDPKRVRPDSSSGPVDATAEQ